jgi:hypothetical protein
MTEERHAETVETVTADTAALAANSAERAQEAAAATMEHAQIAVAAVAQQSAEEIARTQEGLSEWQGSIAQQHAKLASSLEAHVAATDQRLRETTDQLSLILSRLPAPPASPESRESGSGGETPPPQAESPPGAGESPPARRRAHRWI